MSQGSRKRLAKAITIMTQAIKPRWVFNPVNKLHDYHTFLLHHPDRRITKKHYGGLCLPVPAWAVPDWMTQNDWQ